LLDSEPLKAKSLSYDIVLNGEEIGGGSIRINESSLQHKIFKLLNIDDDMIEENFGFLVKALWVSVFAYFYWGVYEHLYEFSRQESVSNTIPVDPVRADKCGKGDNSSL